MSLRLCVRLARRSVPLLRPQVGISEEMGRLCRSLSTSHSHKAEKKLFTPGPLGTSLTVRQAMLQDLGSRDVNFINVIKKIRADLLNIAEVSPSEFTSVLLQGSGTFAVESIFQTTVPHTGAKVLILENGVYGRRMKTICDTLAIPAHMESFPEDSRVDLGRVESVLKGDISFTHVAIVQCETTSGLFNDVESVGKLVKKYVPSCTYFVDAMSSFGAVPVDFSTGNIDVLVSSANKCLQGVPGFGFAVIRKDTLSRCKGNSRSLSLDLYDQCDALDKTSQFRFTPATHTMLAFSQALDEFRQEGGVHGRRQRYTENCRVLREGMTRLGFRPYLKDDVAGYIITSYFYPQHPNFSFPEFYRRLNDKDDVIYPGKLLKADCFRIGTIGHLFPEDVERLLRNIEVVCRDMGMQVPLEN
ncbi:2-aminoethylphosphonate--pyruvate transaminase-like [Haliotis rufescens]|uniref:2-aminoethylphosphonate--pyruvate transaminase-like n=1 Tax=Haliotis rufescens TaxID=6454 RepID=UPI00201F4B14|nr:2-aminoethylphosphonate--pyruvate transaminase-like [Haliotis rufescens]